MLTWRCRAGNAAATSVHILLLRAGYKKIGRRYRYGKQDGAVMTSLSSARGGCGVGAPASASPLALKSWALCRYTDEFGRCRSPGRLRHGRCYPRRYPRAVVKALNQRVESVAAPSVSPAPPMVDEHLGSAKVGPFEDRRRRGEDRGEDRERRGQIK